jgi:hypothetical protein
MIVFAGVILYVVDPIYGPCLVLGRELTGELNPFGGGPKSDNYKLEAAREFEEETMGMFCDTSAMYEKLTHANYYVNATSITFFCRLMMSLDELKTLQIVFQNVFKHFNKCTGYPEGYLEMTELVVVPLNSISQRQDLRPAFRDNLDSILRTFYTLEYI